MSEHTTKDGNVFFIRKPDENDAEKIIQYSKLLFASTDQVLTLPEEYTITIEEEKVWVKNSLQNRSAFTIVATMNENIIGLLFFVPLTKIKNHHSGEFGVSVHPDYQAKGVGRALIETLLSWAKANSAIEKVFLNVFATNTNAIKLYSSMGFTEEGRHVKAIKQITDEYIDIIQMYMETK